MFESENIVPEKQAFSAEVFLDDWNWKFVLRHRGITCKAKKAHTDVCQCLRSRTCLWDLETKHEDVIIPWNEYLQ